MNVRCWPILLKKSAVVSTAEKYALQIEIFTLSRGFRTQISRSYAQKSRFQQSVRGQSGRTDFFNTIGQKLPIARARKRQKRPIPFRVEISCERGSSYRASFCFHSRKVQSIASLSKVTEDMLILESRGTRTVLSEPHTPIRPCCRPTTICRRGSGHHASMRQPDHRAFSFPRL